MPPSLPRALRLGSGHRKRPTLSRPLRLGIGHRKGGTTKTTAAVYLALSLAERYPHDAIALVDADRTNDSTSAWARLATDEWPANVTVHSWPPDERLVEFVQRVVPATSHLVIDTGPHDQSALADAMRLADIFIIPLRPSKMEVASLFPTLQIAGAVYDEAPFELRVLFADSDRRTIVHREADEALAELTIPRLTTEIPHSVRYIEAFGKVPTSLGAFPDLLDEITEIGETT